MGAHGAGFVLAYLPASGGGFAQHCFGVVPETPELVTRASSSHPALSRRGSDTSQQLTDRSEALVDDEDYSDQDQGSDPVSENAEEEADGDGGAEVQTVHLDLRVSDGCR